MLLPPKLTCACLQISAIQNDFQAAQRLKGIPCVRSLVALSEDAETVTLTYSPAAPPAQRGAEGELTLLEYIKSAGKLDEDEARLIFSQVATALACCHDRLVVLRDLKLPSVLINPATKRIRLADFSHASVLEREDQLLTDRRGSPAYICPEVVIGQPYRGDIADCWSLGVLLYAMLCGTFPFADSTPMGLFEKIVKATVAYPGHLSPEACSLLRGLLKPGPSSRLSAREALEHHWLEPLCEEDDDDQTVPDMMD